MDSVIKSDVIYQEHTGELHHKTTQPTENLILERNKKLRNNSGALQDLGTQIDGNSWGRQVASIPFILFERAIREGYDLNSKDKDIAQKELFRFLQSDLGKPCLVTEKL